MRLALGDWLNALLLERNRGAITFVDQVCIEASGYLSAVTIIHTSPLPDVEIPDVTITAHVLRKVGDMPDRVAIRDAAGTSSYTLPS